MKKTKFLLWILITSLFIGAEAKKITVSSKTELRVVSDEEEIKPKRIVEAVSVFHKAFPKGTRSLDLCSLSTYKWLPHNEYISIKIDPRNRRIEETGYRPPLTERAQQAVEKAPAWLKDDLIISFSQLSNAHQDMYANVILSVDNPIIDEVAFQVAHLSYQTLTASYANPNLLVINAEKIYEIAPYLQYVELIDHGSYPHDPNYYTTVRYRVIDSGDTIWTEEYPKEIYYWFIVHPKLSDEKVKMTDLDGDVRQRTYGYFWREYLLFNPSSTRAYTTEDSLVLGNVLRIPRYLWTRSDSSFPPGRPFGRDDSALDIIGNWVSKILPYGAAAPRPIQPNQIAYSHHGYCGEVQDLLAAATRCALIPCAATMDPAEDHVWNEFYDRTWEYYQVDREGGGTSIGYDGGRQDVDYGGGKNISMIWNYWGNGYVEDVSHRYSQVCTLLVTVRDELGFPMDGTLILVATEGFYDTTTLDITGCAFTNRFGQAKFVVGDRRNFYIRAESPIGNYPSTGSVILVARNTMPGRVYTANITIRGHVPFLPVEEELTPPDSATTNYAIALSYNIPYEYIVQNNSYFDSEGSEFRWLSEKGAVAFFICDSANYELFTTSRPFRAYLYEELTQNGEIEFYIPDTSTCWYIVFSNQNSLRHIQKVELTARLVQPGTYAFDHLIRPTISQSFSYPNPFNDAAKFEIIPATPGICKLELYDICGQIVRQAEFRIANASEKVSYTWDGKDSFGRELPSGIYLGRVSINGKIIGTHRLVMLK